MAAVKTCFGCCIKPHVGGEAASEGPRFIDLMALAFDRNEAETEIVILTTEVEGPRSAIAFKGTLVVVVENP